MKDNKIILYGTKCQTTGLWLVPIAFSNQIKEQNKIPTISHHQIHNVHHTSTQKELIEYIHQCMFSPTKSTLIKAIQNNQLLGIPGMDTKLVNRHLQETPATIKGHLHRTRKNLRSTSKTNLKENTLHQDDMHPVPDTNAPCELFFLQHLQKHIQTHYTQI